MSKCPRGDIFKRDCASQKSAHAVMGSECLVLSGQEGGRGGSAMRGAAVLASNRIFDLRDFGCRELSFNDEVLKR